MKRWMVAALLGSVVAGGLYADVAPLWKDYANALVGIHLQIRKDWQVVEIKETTVTGTAAFNLSPHTTISIVRQNWGQPFEVWLSSSVLTQIFKPGYKITHTEFAGRKSVEVRGTALDDRLQQSYYSDRPPFIDEITFTSPSDEWPQYQNAIDTVKKTIHWTRP